MDNIISTKFELKYTCICGITTSKYNRQKHQETKKHIIWWINQNYTFENEILKKEFIKNYFN